MTAWLRLAILALVVAVAGCAGTGGARDAGAEPEAPAAAPAEPLSEDAVYGVLAGEYLGAEGDLAGAAQALREEDLVPSEPTTVATR